MRKFADKLRSIRADIDAVSKETDTEDKIIEIQNALTGMVGFLEELHERLLRLAD